jgi:integrase
MPLKIYKRADSPYYQITGTLCGQRVRQSTGTDDEEKAERQRIDLERSILDGHSPTKTVAHAVVAYIENNGENKYLDKIVETLGHLPLDKVTQEDIDGAARKAYPGYKRGKKGSFRKHTPATIKRHFYVPLAAVLHYAADLQWMPYRRIRAPKVKRPPPKWAEPDWFQKLWAVADPELKAITMFLSRTGCRIQECLDMKWEDVDLKAGTAFVRKTKTGAHRTAHLPPMLVSVLTALQGEGHVFRYRNRHNFRSSLRSACKKAGIVYMSSHQIGSHTYATLMRRHAGMDAKGLVSTGRWADEKSTYIYTHAKVSDEAKKADSLDELFE